MKIIIVGNSNCVFKFGFSKLIKDTFEAAGHEVINMSVGGSCSLFHIYTLHTNRALFESADIVILDSMIIDTYHNRRGTMLDDQIATSIHDMYAGYAALDALVVSVFFPSMAFIGKHRDAVVYSNHRRVCEMYGITVMDLYEEIAKFPDFERFFMKDSHIEVKFSQQIAEILARHLLAQDSLDMRPTVTLTHDPYSSTDLSAPPLSVLKQTTESSKFFDKTVGILSHALPLGAFAGNRLMGIFQWNKEDGSRVRLSGGPGPDAVRQLRANFALFDVLTTEPELGEDSTLAPTTEDDPITDGPRGLGVKDSFGTPHVMGMLFKRTGETLTAQVADHARDQGCIDLTYLIEGKVFDAAE